MDEYSLTRFPNLLLLRDDLIDWEQHHEKSFAIDSTTQKEDIVRAWAALLKAYTGDDVIRFILDASVVTVDWSTSKTETSNETNSKYAGATGIFFAEAAIHQDGRGASEGQLALTLCIDSSSLEATLGYNGVTTLENLEEIYKQLRIELSRAQKLTKTSTSDEEPRLSIVNNHPKVVEGPQLLHQLIGLKGIPQSSAIDFLEIDGTQGQLSYDSFHEQASAVANKLESIFKNLNLESEEQIIIPVLIPQCLELYVALLGVLKAGAAFCPLTLDTPEERMHFIFNDISASCIITIASLKHKIPRSSQIAICEVELHELTNATHFVSPIREPAPEDLAYIMYTSGSTGRPKGVALSHFAVTQSLLAHDLVIPQYSRFLQFASPTFDVSMFEIFFTFFRGSTLVGCNRSELLNDLPTTMQKLQVDAAELTPTVAGSLLRKREKAPELKLLLTIGEMLTTSVVQEFGNSPEMKSILWGMYGPTEAAIHCTLHQSFDSKEKVGLIGQPLDTVSAFIVAPAEAGSKSTNIHILPIGQVGELVVGGHQLASGYLNRQEQTNEVFINHPTYGPLYRTGDKARLLSDGETLECLGRIGAGQVKLRGQRVELGEIEQVVLKTRGCLLAVSIVSNENLVAFCTGDPKILTKENVFETCKRWLPIFMVPSEVILLENFPRLASGKIDKKKLLQMRLEMVKEYQDKANEDEEGDFVENRVRSTTAKVIGRSIQLNTILSRNGLDSLSAIRLASELRRIEFSISPLDILQADNVRSIASTIRDTEDTFSSVDDTTYLKADFTRLTEDAIECGNISRWRSNIEHVLPCTPLQTAMLVETSIDPRAYCNWVEIEVDQDIQNDNIKAAICTVVRGNEIFRTGFVALGTKRNTFCQVVWKPELSPVIETVTSFQHQFEVSSEENLLWPLKFQINSDRNNILIQLHHALYDGWSIDLIVEDLNRILAGKRLDSRPQFGDITRYYSYLYTNDAMESSKDYWNEQLKGFEPASLPNLSTTRSTSNKTLSTTSTLRINEKLREAAQYHHCHPQVFFQASLAYLLGVYMGKSDVLFGTVTSGRTIPVTGVEDVVGPCIATLPLRIDVAPDKVLNTLIREIKNSNRRLLEHCTLSLQEIKRSTDIDPGRPLFDTLFVWQESLKTSTADRKAKVVDSADFLEFNLILEVIPGQDSLELKTSYRESILPTPQAEKFIEQLSHIVLFILDSSNKTIDEIGNHMEETALSIENANPQQRASKKSLASYVEHMAQEYPSRCAVSIASIHDANLVEGESLTYQELNMRSNKLARAIIDYGVNPNDLVCVFMEKCGDLYVSILAAIKAGAGYLPITPKTPQSRVKLIVEEASVSVCLVTPNSPRFIHEIEGLSAIDTQSKLENYDGSNVLNPYVGDNIAYAVFTSGSTGTPKGVLVTQENLANNIEALGEIYPFSDNSKMLQACSQAFDVSAFEIFFSWYAGMCLCAGTNDVLFRDLEEAINFFGVTHLSLTPTVAALVDPTNVPQTTFLVTAGEGVTDLVFKRWAGRGLYNGYGPSETTNICSVNPNAQPEDFLNHVGPPLKNTSAFVLREGEGCHIIPRGGIGELCFGGYQVFWGYLNSPDLSASKIITHEKYGRMYRSGDLGRILHDGSIVILGRTDDQVKIRGQRIELGEINSVLTGSDKVQDCKTVVVEGEEDHQQHLVGFWLPSRSKPEDSLILPLTEDIIQANREIYSQLIESLPTYMVPTTLVPVSKLPMTSQGKIDSQALVKSFRSLSLDYLNSVSINQTEDEDNDGEWSDLEKNVRESLSFVTDVPESNIRRNTSFFSLGLDSLSAISLARSIEKTTGNYVEVSRILRNANIAQLATKISSGQPISTSIHLDLSTVFSKTTLTTIHESFKQHGLELEKIRPCTPVQEAMLSAEFGSQKLAYQNHTLFDIYCDSNILEDCFNVMCKRHDILRTCFVTTEESLFPFAQVTLLSHHILWKEINTGEGDFDTVVGKETKRIIPALDTFEPPIKITQVQCSTNTKVVLSMHHALYDAEAMSVLLLEIEQAYWNRSLKRSISFDLVLQKFLSVDTNRADAYWRDMLRDYVPLQFPKLSKSIKTGNSQQDVIETISHHLQLSFGDVENICQKISVTMLSILQAAWTKLLSKVLNDPDVCFGNIVSGRTIAIDGIKRLVAPCFNTLPVRVRPSLKATNRDLIQSLHRINTCSLDQQFTPLRRIQSRCSKNRESLFDTLFLLQSPSRKLDSRIWRFDGDFGEMGFPVVCEVMPFPEDDLIQVKLHHNTDLISTDQAQILLESYDSALDSCVNDLEEPFLSFTSEALDQIARNQEDRIYIHGSSLSIAEMLSAVDEKVPGMQVSAIVKLNQDPITLGVVLVNANSQSSEDVSSSVRRELQGWLQDTSIDIKIHVFGPNDQIIQKPLFQGRVKRIFKDINDSKKSSDNLHKNRGQKGLPQSATESHVREVFSHFSKVSQDQIRSNQTIYQLGLDSISGIQIAKVLRSKGHNVSAEQVFEYPTTSKLADFIDSNTGKSELHSSFDFAAFNAKYKHVACDQIGLSSEKVQCVRPCTALQAGLISQSTHHKGSVYFNRTTFELYQDVKLNKLKDAWANALKTHEMLRTGFISLEDANFPCIMVCYNEGEIDLPWYESLNHNDLNNDTPRLKNAFVSKSLENLDRPPWQLQLDERCSPPQLHFFCHHALYDAETLQMILDSVYTAYWDEEHSSCEPIEPLLGAIINVAEDPYKVHEKFWKNQLQEATPTSFPDLTPLHIYTRHVRKESLAAEGVLNDLENHCRRANVTLQAALQTTWAILLSQYTGEADVILGVVLSGRDMEGASDTAFPSTVTLPYRCNASSGIGSMLESAMNFNVSVRKHQHTPLNQIQRWAELGNQALFDTILVFQRGRETANEKQRELWKIVEEDATVEYPVSLEVTPRSDDLKIQLVFWDDYLPVEHAKLLLEQFHIVLSQVCAHDQHTSTGLRLPSKSLSALPPKIRSISAPSETLHGLFESTATNFPDRIALEFHKSLEDNAVPEKMTYGHLDGSANKVANLLLDQGVQVGQLIAVCFDKSLEASIVLLGILKSGCGFVALDPSAPAARKSFIIHDSAAVAFISTNSFISDVEDTGIPMISVDTIDWSGLSPKSPLASLKVDPQSPSYCLYTSGSTGTPKGCLLTHENSVQAMMSFQRLFVGRWNENSRWLQFASFHFDVSVLEQFWSWSVGICVVSTPRDVLFEDLPNALRLLDITHIDLTPSLARLITPEDVPSLCPGVFITGGEQLKQEILDIWGPHHVIHNGYGPTECTIGVTMYTRVPENGKPSNIGWQFDNVGTYVFKAGTTEIVPRGSVGELCISGKLVGKGYLNRPEQTEAAFPYIEEYGETVYRTKDLVRMLHDGSFQFLGRDDDQVKLRGQRLELGEVNSAIEGSSIKVKEVSTLIVKQNEQHSAQLVSFVVLAGSNGSDNDLISTQDSSVIQKVRDRCRERLPGYMIPSRIVLVNRLPLTANNKADTKRLESLFNELNGTQPENDSSGTECGTSEREQIIIQTFSSFFSIPNDQISYSSNLYNLGLDSISVFAFTRALKNAGLQAAHPALILSVDTVTDLAKTLGEPVQKNSQASVFAAQQEIAACRHRYSSRVAQYTNADEAIEFVLPCTPLQQGMIARSLESGKSLYFNSFMYKLDHNIDLKRLHSAWQKVYFSTSILRTKFVPVEEGHIQAVVQNPDIPWTEEHVGNSNSLRAAAETRRESWAKANSEWIATPFELVIIRSDAETCMVLNIFHGLYDAIAYDLLMQKLLAYYNDETIPNSEPAFADVLPYGPLRSAEGSEIFWKRNLQDAQFQELPKQQSSNEGGTTIAKLSIVDLDALENLRKHLKVTHQALIQTCWMIVIQRYIGAPTTVGFVVSGRSIDFAEAERVIGPMFNTIPFFIQLDRNDEWSTVVRKCHDFNVAALSYQHTPLRDITKWCRRSGQTFLFDSLFVFQKGIVRQKDTPSWIEMESAPVADYPLAFEVEQLANLNLQLSLVAQSSVMNYDGCTNLLAQFEQTLRSLIFDPQQSMENVLPLSFFDSQVSVENKAQLADISTKQDQKKKLHELSNLEQQILQEVANIAGIEPNSIDDGKSILELGLDSIDAIKLSSRLKQKSITLPVSTIMRSQNIAEMASLATKNSDLSDSHLPNGKIMPFTKSLEESILQNDVELSSVDAVLPATPLQEAIVAEMHASNFQNYFNHDVMRLNPDTDLNRLQEAWNRVISVSPILRTSFIAVEDPEIGFSFAQLVHKSHDTTWKVIETSSEVSKDVVLEQIRQDFANSRDDNVPLNLAIWKHAGFSDIILSVSHALYDGWSLSLIHQDVNFAYQRRLEHRPPYEGILQRIVDAGGPEAEKFWKTIVSDATPCKFPSKLTANQDKMKVKDYIKEIISAIPEEKAQAVCRKKICTAQALGQTCWALVLASYVKNLDVTFGVVQSGRDDEESQSILFPTMNTVAVRSVIHGTLGKMLQYMQAGLADLIEYQHFPLRKIQALAGLQGQKLFDTLFIYQKKAGREEDSAGLYYSIDDSSAVEYPVCVEMEMVDGNIIWRIASNDKILTSDEASKVIEKLDSVLQQLIDSPDTPCIKFEGENVSICGLPPFSLSSEREIQQSDSESTTLGSQSEHWSETESQIREVLSKVSKVPQESISKSHTIFHLGLDSISAIKVSSLLRKKDLRVNVSQILKAGQVGDIAGLCQKSQPRTQDDTIATNEVIAKCLKGIRYEDLLKHNGITPGGVERVLPATSGQVYFLSIWQNSSGILFCPTFEYRVEGNITPSDIRDAWVTLAKHLPMLRTTFVATGRDDIPFLQVILNDTSPDARANFDSSRPTHFNFSTPPVQLQIEEASGFILLHLHIHHALYDAVSLPAIIQGLQLLCNNQNEDLNCSECRFDDFVASTISWRDPLVSNFWTEYLEGISCETLPRTSSVQHTERTELYRPTAMSDLTHLWTLTRKSGISFQSYFLAMLASVLARHRNLHRSADIVLGVYLANRSLPLEGLPALPAPTLNVVPLRIRQPLSQDAKEVARQIQKDLHVVGTAQHANVGLWEVSKWTGVVVDCVVNFLTLPESHGEDENANVNAKTKERQVDISEVEEDGAGLGEDRLEMEARSFREPRAVRDNAVRDAYAPSIDVEAAVRDGALDIGVFCPRALLGSTEAEAWIDRIVHGLVELSMAS